MSKLNKEQRLEINNDWKLRNKSVIQIAHERKMNSRSLGYIIKLIDRYGIEIYARPNARFTKEFKEKAITKALTRTKSIFNLSLDLGLRSSGILCNWIREYKKNGYNVVIKKKGRHYNHEQEPQPITQRFREADQATRRRKLEAAYCECLRKKTKYLGSETSREIAQAITELRQEFGVSLDYIFDTLAQNQALPLIARSTYYKVVKPKEKTTKKPKLLLI